jgi:hypothetical protein
MVVAHAAPFSLTPTAAVRALRLLRTFDFLRTLGFLDTRQFFRPFGTFRAFGTINALDAVTTANYVTSVIVANVGACALKQIASGIARCFEASGARWCRARPAERNRARYGRAAIVIGCCRSRVNGVAPFGWRASTPQMARNRKRARPVSRSGRLRPGLIRLS